MISRWQVAGNLATSLKTDRSEAVRRTAAWLVANGRERQADYLARDVALRLVDSGYVLVRLTAARPISAAARQQVEAFVRRETGAKTVEVAETTDTNVLGGVRIDLPGSQLDATARGRLMRLVEGVR